MPKKPNVHVEPRKAKQAPEASPSVTSPALAEQLGVKLTPPLLTKQIRSLRKALPGYVGLLDDVATLLGVDESLLAVKDVTPRELLEVQAEQKLLVARETVTYRVYRSIYEQRLQADDRAMKMLEKLARRVEQKAEDEPELLDRWQLLLGFLKTFRKGGRTAEPPALPPEPPPGGDAPATTARR